MKNLKKRIERLEQEIKQLQQQVRLLSRCAYYIAPPLPDIDIRGMVQVSKM